MVQGVPALVMMLLGAWGVTRENSMWRDEASTWLGTHRTLPELWRMLGQEDAVHGLYYLLMHGIFVGAPDSPLTLRLPSVLAMAAAAAGTAALGRRLGGPWVGLTAGLTFTAIPSSQYYAQEGRSYALVVAAIVLASSLLLNALGARGRAWRLWAAYAFAMVIAVYLNELAILALLAHGVTVLVASRAALVHWLMATGGVALGVLPLLLISFGQREQVSWIGAVTGSRILSVAGMVAVGCLCAAAHACSRASAGESDMTEAGAPAPAARSGSVSLPAFALALFAVPQATLLLASLMWQPLYGDRYVLYGNVGFALLLGAGVDRLLCCELFRMPHRRHQRILVSLPLLALLVLLPKELAMREWDSRIDDVLATANAVEKRSKPGDAVIYLPAARRDTALTSPVAFRGLRDVTLAQNGLDSATLRGIEATPARIRAALLRQNRIVVVSDSDISQHRGRAGRDVAKREAITEHFVLCDETQVRGRHVAVYERGAVCGRS
ncbi:hypothetical protein AB0F46_38720 [Streptomyces sp. NPDC026665]|uniref:glycosyltransferase family 39 protein n=1 Tax=Streptomyces sp. NPDC026665 TaxID=3154798 RepID=UPI0034043233